MGTGKYVEDMVQTREIQQYVSTETMFARQGSYCCYVEGREEFQSF
jgi:hypothetical protein